MSLNSPRTFALAAIICIAFGIVVGYAFAMTLSRATVTYTETPTIQLVYGGPQYPLIQYSKTYTRYLTFAEGFGYMLAFFMVAGFCGALPHMAGFKNIVDRIIGEEDE